MQKSRNNTFDVYEPSLQVFAEVPGQRVQDITWQHISGLEVFGRHFVTFPKQVIFDRTEVELMEVIKDIIEPEKFRDFGGLWRVYIRGNFRHLPRPGKVRRVFAQLRIDKREGFKPRTTWNQYALGLFKEFTDWPSDRW